MKLTTAHLEGVVAQYFEELNISGEIPLLPAFLHKAKCTKDEFKAWWQDNIRDFQLLKQHFESVLATASINWSVDKMAAKMFLDKDFWYTEKDDNIEEVDNLTDEEKADIEHVLQCNLLNND